MRNPCEAPPRETEPRCAPETVEAWAAAYVAAGWPQDKLAPPPVPELWSGKALEAANPRSPGREGPFEVVSRAGKFPRLGALRDRSARTKVLHTFLHHEVQAAELYCQALLRFSDAPQAFRHGLLRLALDEIRHAGLYQALLKVEGATYGTLPVRDWIWARGSECADPIQFVAFVGLGLEAANLDHADRYVRAFAEAGASECSKVQATIGLEEEAHVRFAQGWFDAWTGGRFEDWCKHLPQPLTPLIFRGERMNRSSRLRAGQPPKFLDQLETWQPSGS